MDNYKVFSTFEKRELLIVPAEEATAEKVRNERRRAARYHKLVYVEVAAEVTAMYT